MPNFFKSFFSGKSETPESEKQKNDLKNFEIFKYDGYVRNAWDVQIMQ